MVIHTEHTGEPLIPFGVFLSIIYISYEYSLYLYRRYIVNFFSQTMLINVNTTTKEELIYPLYNVTSGVQTISGVMLNDVRPK